MRPGVIAAWIVLATIFIRELSISMDGDYGRMAPVGRVVTVICALLVTMAQKLFETETE